LSHDVKERVFKGVAIDAESWSDPEWRKAHLERSVRSFIDSQQAFYGSINDLVKYLKEQTIVQ
jgi:hypothetical protein